MFVEIDVKLFEEDNKFVLLDRIIDFFAEGRYNWLPKEEIESSIWIKGARRQYQEFFEDAYTRANAYTTKSEKENCIFVSNVCYEQEDCYTLEDAQTFLNEPICVILENEINDGYFINALLRCFRKKAKKIRRFKENRWLKYDSIGGKNQIAEVLRLKVNEFKGANDKFFVLVDSDKMFLEQDLPSEQEKIKDTCEELNIKYHILEKRETENYLPEEVLFKNIPIELIETGEVYKNLNPIQKDFYDMKKGFNNRSQIPEKQQKLFEDLADREINKLRKGFSKTISLQLFNKDETTQENLKERCGSNELNEILDKINTLL